MPNPLSEHNVPLDTQGWNESFRWTFVGHGGKRVKSHGMYGGTTQMRKKEEKEERYRAFKDNKIPDILMHKHRSHLYGFDASLTAPMTSFHAYQKMMQDQLLHENKWHDMHFPSLVKVPQDKAH